MHFWSPGGVDPFWDPPEALKFAPRSQSGRRRCLIPVNVTFLTRGGLSTTAVQSFCVPAINIIVPKRAAGDTRRDETTRHETRRDETRRDDTTRHETTTRERERERERERKRTNPSPPAPPYNASQANRANHNSCFYFLSFFV